MNPTAIHTGSHLLHLVLRTLATVVAAPFLLAISLMVFLVVLADFSIFRLRALRSGNTHPKGLWEF